MYETTHMQFRAYHVSRSFLSSIKQRWQTYEFSTPVFVNWKCECDYSVKCSDFSLRLCTSSASAVQKFLLYARKQEIRGVHLESPYLNVMPAMTVPNVYTPVTLDYDEKGERIYWTDDSHLNGQLGLHSNGIQGTSFETLDSGLYTSPLHSDLVLLTSCALLF